MKRTFAAIAGLAVAAIAVLAIWPEPGIYLGHEVTSVRVTVPDEGERDHELLRCRYLSLDGYEVVEKWPAHTKPGTRLEPDGEEALVDGQDCLAPWPGIPEG